MNKRTKKTLANIVIIFLIVCGIAWIASIFIHIGGEYTDNAQIKQDIINVDSRVQGFVERIYVDEYRHVNKGDTLLTVESSEYRLHLAQAEAGLQQALAGRAAGLKGISGVTNNIAVTDAGINELTILLQNAETEFQRYQKLYDQEVVTKQQYDAVRTNYESLKAKVETMERQRIGTGLVRDEQTIRIEQLDAAIEVAQAALNLARLNLGYCTVLSPCSGYTSRKMVQVGELIQPGMRLYSVVDEDHKWIIANYRETQMRGITVGDKVEIKVDAFDNEKYQGIVAAVSTATGAEYSLVAPDNSTGNFVKVEQRVPVKIVFSDSNDKALLDKLAAGMNANCKVLSR